MKAGLTVLMFFLTTVLAVACATVPPENTPMNGRVLLWHEWQGTEAQILNDLIAEFTEIHPGVEVISVPTSAGTIVSRFQDRSDSGLGPDMMLLNSRSVFELAESGFIDDISNQVNLEEQQYLPAALAMLQRDDQLFGIPFTVHSQVLFYNKALVESPQAPPGFILDTDTQRLREMFISGEVAYYVGPSSDLPALQAALGERVLLETAEVAINEQQTEDETVAPTLTIPPVQDTGVLGVTTLPVGPNEWQPTPILQTDAFVFSQISSAQEQALALALAEFLTNPQQQTRLAAEGIGRIPAGNAIQRNRNLPESAVALVKQIRTAVAIPYAIRSTWDAFVQERGEIDTEYTRALQGILSANEFIDESAVLVESQLGVESGQKDLSLYCISQAGSETVSLLLWHALPEVQAKAMTEIAQNYEALCEGVDLEIKTIAADKIIEQYIAAAEDGSGPDILLESSRWTSQLAEKGLIADLSDTVKPEDLEPLIPEAAVSMRLPESSIWYPPVGFHIGAIV